MTRCVMSVWKEEATNFLQPPYKLIGSKYLILKREILVEYSFYLTTLILS